MVRSFLSRTHMTLADQCFEVMRADPASAAAKGVVSQSGAGYLAMVCVYLVSDSMLRICD